MCIIRPQRNKQKTYSYIKYLKVFSTKSRIKIDILSKLELHNGWVYLPNIDFENY